MQTSTSFDIAIAAVNSAALQELSALAGRPASGAVIMMGFKDADPRIARVLAILEREGVSPTPWRRGRKPSPPCSMLIRRKYSKKDLSQSDYLEILAGPDWNGQRFETGGPLELSERKNRRGIDVCGVAMRIVVVRHRVRVLAEEAGLLHVTFGGTALTNRFSEPSPTNELRRRWAWESIGEEPWWELTSDLRLPRVSPSVELVDNDGSPYIPGVSPGCWAQEGFFHYPELHYREAEIRALGPFDCALTHEPFGGNPREENLTRIISRRFYELLIDNGIRIDCVPVRLDPG